MSYRIVELTRATRVRYSAPCNHDASRHLFAPGARVGLIAPSGPLRDATDLDHAITNTRALGWEPVVGEHVLERDGYLAGSDDARASPISTGSPRDDSIDAHLVPSRRLWRDALLDVARLRGIRAAPESAHRLFRRDRAARGVREAREPRHVPRPDRARAP